MSDSDNDSMNGSMDEFDMEGEQSSTAIVLAGMELTAGAEPQPIAPAGELPSSAVVTLTRATLVMQKPLPNNAMFYLRSHINEEQVIVLTVLSNAHPTSALDLNFHADSVPEFSVECIGAAAPDSVAVHISGYVEVSGDVDEDDEDEDDEVDMEKMLAGLKDEESDEEEVNPKKRKAAAVDEEIDSDEVDEPAAAPAKPAAKVQKTAQPQSQSQKQAASAAPQTIKLANGLQLTDELVGNGVEAKAGKSVQIRYKGELMNGKVFDTNMPRGKPFSFKLGAGECIPGFDAGIKGMKVGGRRVLVIPAQLGYGKKGSPPQIPGNATLKFTVELLKA